MQEKNTNDPTREDNILRRNKTRLALCEEHLKDPTSGAGKSPEVCVCVCGKLVLEVSARVLGGRSVLQWLALASSKGCGKSRAGRAFGPTWIRWILCVRRASMERNAPGKYGPYGELFFFPIKKEPASMPDGETFSAFVNADIRTPSFSVDVLKKCALIALH